MKEMLYDGPLDGLELEGSGPTYTPTHDVLAIYPQAVGAVYVRRGDGRLYLVNSRWDMKGQS